MILLYLENMDMENFIGKMVDIIKVCGKMENNMVQVFILIKMENLNKEYGKTEKCRNGMTIWK